MTTLTLFDLVIRSMRKNIKHYYLYFFAFIFSTCLYFIFASLRHDPSIIQMTSTDVDFKTAFEVAGILLLVIVVIFTVNANSIFLKRRSKEIGLYQLIGMRKKRIARLLIIENVLLGVGALFVGIISGALVSRLFLIILMSLLGYQGFISMTFSVAAAIQTGLVFSALIVLTSVQMQRTVYSNTLYGLLHADKKEEHPKKPKTAVSAGLALLGIALIAIGYFHSLNMSGKTLFFDMLAVLATTILGTYLLFRISISWLFYRFRMRKDGHLGLQNSLSLASLMHRMKSNAKSLTMITVLSAMAITTLSLSYSMYYAAESDTRIMLPYDFVFENNTKEMESFRADMEQARIPYDHKTIEALRVVENYGLLFLPAEQLQKAGMDVEIPEKGKVALYDGRAKLNEIGNDGVSKLSKRIEMTNQGRTATVERVNVVDKFAMNYSVYGVQYVASEETVKEIRETMLGADKTKAIRFDTFQVSNMEERAKASEMYAKYVTEEDFMPDFYTQYKAYHQAFGLVIFVSGFLGLVFLISTGSILYFKQMTEAEQEKKSYTTLRQLGFDGKDIVSGIVRKQLFVFGIPLVIGILHSVFAVKAGSILVLSSILVPTVMAMGVYALIYLVFAYLTIGYYKKIVKEAL